VVGGLDISDVTAAMMEALRVTFRSSAAAAAVDV